MAGQPTLKIKKGLDVGWLAGAGVFIWEADYKSDLIKTNDSVPSTRVLISSLYQRFDYRESCSLDIIRPIHYTLDISATLHLGCRRALHLSSSVRQPHQIWA